MKQTGGEEEYVLTWGTSRGLSKEWHKQKVTFTKKGISKMLMKQLLSRENLIMALKRVKSNGVMESTICP